MECKRLTHLLVLAGFLIAPAIALSGCNTMEGAGEDIERSGEWIQKKSDDVQD